MYQWHNHELYDLVSFPDHDRTHTDSSVWESNYVRSLVPRHSSQYVMTTATKTKVHCDTFSSLRVEVFSERDEESFVEGYHIWIEGRLHVG